MCEHKHSFRLTKKLLEVWNTLKLPNVDTVVPFHGFKFLIRNPRKSLIGRSVFLTGVYEKEATNFIYHKIKKGMNVVDVGADVGYYTLLFVSRVGPSGNIYAFEPIPKSKKYLDENIAINTIKNVKTYDFALFDRPGTVCLEFPLKKSKINLSKKKLAQGDIYVQMRVFDDLMKGEKIKTVDLIKIDVEGAELNVLLGMKQTLKENHPKLLIEVHEGLMKSFNFSRSDLINFLSDMKYKITFISENTTAIYCD